MSIMKEEPVGVIARYRFSEPLHRPIGCRLGGDIAVKDAAGPDGTAWNERASEGTGKNQTLLIMRGRSSAGQNAL